MTQNYNSSADDGHEVAYHPKDDFEDEIDLGELLAVLLGGKWWVVGIAAVALLLGGFYAWTAPRMYPADALVQVEQAQRGLSSMFSEELGSMLGEEAPTAAEIELLQSRLVIGRVVDDLKLFIAAEPERFPVIGEAFARGWRAEEGQPFRSPFLGFDSYAWGGETIAVTQLDVPESLLGQTLTIIARPDGYYDLIGPDGEGLAREGRVAEEFSPETRYGKLTLFVQSLEARPGTRFKLLRKHRHHVISALKSDLSITEQGRQSGILSISSVAKSPEAAAARVNRLVEAYQRQNVERRSEEADQTLQFVRGQLPEIREELRAAETELNAFRSERGSANITKETEIILQQNVELEQNKLALQQQRQEALRRFTTDHPVVESLDAQMRRLDGELEQVSGQVRNLPETQRELLRLMRDVEVSTQLYTSLLNTAQELQVARAGTVGNVRIVDRAVEPLQPSSPRVGLILALSLMMGLMLGVIFIFLRRALQRGVLEPGQVEREVGLSTYASIPFSPLERRMNKLRLRGRKQGSGLLAVDNPQDVCTEALRSLRTALHFALMDAPNRIIAFTGPSPELGKSFVSLNFGAVLAEAGQRVLVIDLDLRRGHMHKVLGLGRAPGITDCVAGRADLADAIHKNPDQSNFFFLASGTLPPNPSELLMSDRFQRLLEQLQQRFDYIIIDTPPVLAVTDAAIIGRLAGTTLMVLKEGAHPVPVLRDSLQRLRQAGVAVRGVVFNMVGRTPGRYGGQYSYRYGYTYEYKSVKK